MFFLRVVSAGSRSAVAAERAGENVEIAYQRPMVREAYVRYPEIGDLDLRADQYEVQFHPRTRAGKEGNSRVFALRRPAARMNR